MDTVKLVWILVFGYAVSAADPKPCCFGREYETDMGVIGSNFASRHYNYFEGFSSASTDSFNKMVSIRTHVVVNGTISYFNLIFDHPNKREYVLNNGKCDVYELNAPMADPCIPDNAKFVREAIYGYGSNTLYANTFKYKDARGDVTMSVTKDGCIPLVTTTYRQHSPIAGGRKQDMVLIYSNFHVGIRNRNVFSVPTACANKTPKKQSSNIFP